MYRALACPDPVASASGQKTVVAAAVKDVARRLGNTPAVCRQSYIHPAVIEAYLDGSLGGHVIERDSSSEENAPGTDPDDESALLTLLRRRLESIEPAESTRDTAA